MSRDETTLSRTLVNRVWPSHIPLSRKRERAGRGRGRGQTGASRAHTDHG